MCVYIYMYNDIEDTKVALAADEKFLAERNKGCKNTELWWAKIKKTRAE